MKQFPAAATACVASARTPVHTLSLHHVYIVIPGSKIREHISGGAIEDDDRETGRAAFSRARGKLHSFENAGTMPYEMISIELKSPVQ